MLCGFVCVCVVLDDVVIDVMKFKVLVVGGGIAGFVAAAAC